MMRTSILFLLLVFLAPPATSRAQALGDPAIPDEEENGDKVETYELSNRVETSDVGLFMPDERWKKIKTGPPKMKVGTWAEYAVTNPEFNLGTLRLSVVPQSGLPSSKWRILEMLSIDGTGDKTYIKVAFAKASTDLRNARGMIFKAAGMPPLVLPIGGGEEENDDAFTVRVEKSGTEPAKVKYLGEKTVTVPAGKFQTWHYKITGKRPDGKSYTSEIWFDSTPSVPVLRVVKARESKTIIELKAKGTGAKSDLPYLQVARPKKKAKAKAGPKAE